MTTTDYRIDATRFSEAYTTVRSLSGTDRGDLDTLGIVRLRLYADGILVDATDRTSFAQAFVPLRDTNIDWPTGDDFELYSVEDRARRVDGLLKHLAKDQEVVKLSTVERPPSPLGISQQPDLVIEGGRESITAKLLSTTMGGTAIDDFFGQIEPAAVGRFGIENAASQIARMVSAVGPVDVTTAEGLLIIKPLTDPGYMFRAVVAVRSHADLEALHAEVAEVEEVDEAA